MASLNKVFLMGNVTRDPELRYTPSGKAVLDLGLAVNRRTKDSNGNWREDPTFLQVTIWDKAAENCAEYLSKGRPVLVEGRLSMDQWEDKKTGEKRSKLRVTAENVQFLGARPAGSAPRTAPGAAAEESGEPAAPPAAPPTPEGNELTDDDIPF